MVGGVSEIDETLVERPALDDDVALLPVEWKVRAVDVARSLPHSDCPPVHSSSVLHFHVEHLEILREEVVHAGSSPTSTNMKYAAKRRVVPC